jgi:hypothetical protein
VASPAAGFGRRKWYAAETKVTPTMHPVWLCCRFFGIPSGLSMLIECWIRILASKNKVKLLFPRLSKSQHQGQIIL